ncbi:MAG: ATP-binding protein [Puniceicoccales bacterium]|jgi:hypothetical protein|nr:ATP-binding protein [Puniceicoccales bacterium]
MKNLPIGIQSFKDLREKDYLYVDKTADILRLVSDGEVYFLSRPRRFGKSLLLSTLEELFKGNKALFEGLAIYDKWDWSKQHPVIRIDWSTLAHQTFEEMTESILARLQQTADENQIAFRTAIPATCLAELIEGLHKKTGNQVVVLIDEYDKPILDVLTHPREEVQRVRNFLRSLYGILKGTGEHLRFVFLTGIAKFSGLSVFSELNNLNDITFHDEYSAICGYTQTELETCFPEHIASASTSLKIDQKRLLESLKFWYNGYSWNGEISVYNPFSILLFFNHKKFSNFWFSSGTPTFLLDIIKKCDAFSIVLQPMTASAIRVASFDPENISPLPLLFQSGYLTIKKIRPDPLFLDEPEYLLDFPNDEVRKSFLSYLLSTFNQLPPGESRDLSLQMQRQLYHGEVAALEQGLRKMLASVPYPLHIGNEAYYHSLFLVWLRLLGFEIQGEIMTDIGRMDAVWQFKGHVVVAEVKFSIEAGHLPELLDAALSQIKEKRYADRYLSSAQRLSLLGVAFSGKEIACRLEVLKDETATASTTAA